MKLDDIFEAGPKIDNIHGMGAVGISGNIDYMGLRVYVKPSVFLKLAYSHPNLDTTYIQQQLSIGQAIGAPFLSIAIPESWISPDSHYEKVVEGDLTEPAEITGHEGRHRMAAILKEYGDVPVETHLVFNGLRRRHITDNMIERLNSDILNEHGKLLIGPWFSLTETITEADADFIYRNFLKDINIYGITKALHKISLRIERADADGEDPETTRSILTDHKELILKELLSWIKLCEYKEDIYEVIKAIKYVNSIGIDWPEFETIKKGCKSIAASAPSNPFQLGYHEINENFADGKGPGRPGDSRRHGIPKHATLSQLDKIGKGSGRKAQLARWQANMRRGRAKVNENELGSYMPLDIAQLKELLSVVQDQQEIVDDHSFDVEPGTVAYKQIEQEYRALTAIEYVVKNNIKAINNPELQPGAIFVYDWEYDDAIGAAQLQVTGTVAELKWLGSYNSSGKQLIKQGLSHAKTMGAKSVNLTSKWGSAEYYKKQGFTPKDNVADNPITDVGTSFTKDIDEASQQYKKISPELIKDIVATVPQTREIWFHGSRATGAHRRDSDWDILVVVPDDIKGNTYIDIIELLRNIERNYPNYDIQPAHPRNMITNIAREEGVLLWSHKPPVTEAIAPHGDFNNELRMMKAGTKPAAIIDPMVYEHMYKPLVNDYGWEVVTFNNNYGRRYVVGQMGEYARIKRIADLVDNMNKKMEQGVKATPEYHIQLGRLLGYSEQDIEDFLKKLADHS